MKELITIDFLDRCLVYMKRVRLLIACALTIGCHPNETPKDFIDMFNKTKGDLDLVIERIETDKNLNTLFYSTDRWLPDIKLSYPEVYQALKKAGVTEVSSGKNMHPKGTHWYDFKTNWSDNYPIYLIYNRYDSSQTKKGFYLKDEVLNETWGLGQNWLMFRLVKEK